MRIKGFLNFDDLNVEVKAQRVEFKNHDQLVNFLHYHRDQLPKDLNRAFFIKLFLEKQHIDLAEVIKATQEFLRRTDRVRFIVYCGDLSGAENEIKLAYWCVNMSG